MSLGIAMGHDLVLDFWGWMGRDGIEDSGIWGVGWIILATLVIGPITLPPVSVIIVIGFDLVDPFYLRSMCGITCPVYYSFPCHEQNLPLWQHRIPRRTTSVQQLHVFHLPISAIRALKSHLLVRLELQRTLPFWELVRKLIRVGRRKAQSLSQLSPMFGLARCV